MVTPLSHNTELVNSLMEYAESGIQCQIPKKLHRTLIVKESFSEIIRDEFSGLIKNQIYIYLVKSKEVQIVYHLNSLSYET